MENKFKPIKLEITENKPIQFDTQLLFNQSYINDLTQLLKTNSTVPTNTPKKFIDCFYLYKNGTTFKLYVYIDNTWKSVTLS